MDNLAIQAGYKAILIHKYQFCKSMYMYVHMLELKKAHVKTYVRSSQCVALCGLSNFHVSSKDRYGTELHPVCNAAIHKT